MLVQNSRKEDYTMQTMFISVPEVTSNGMSYEVTAKPKIATIDAHNDNNEDIIELYKTPDNSEERLPSTGVLNWPIPVFGILGITLFCTSWIIFYSKKKIK